MYLLDEVRDATETWYAAVAAEARARGMAMPARLSSVDLDAVHITKDITLLHQPLSVPRFSTPVEHAKPDAAEVTRSAVVVAPTAEEANHVRHAADYERMGVDLEPSSSNRPRGQSQPSQFQADAIHTEHVQGSPSLPSLPSESDACLSGEVIKVESHKQTQAEEEMLELAPAVLRLTQTCGLPLTSTMLGRARVVGTPCYACRGCDGPRYSSAIVVRRDDPATGPEDLRGAVAAVNDSNSLSGALLLAAWLGPVAPSIITQLSGAHVASVAAVVAGRARFAAIDAVTYALLCKHRPAAVADLRVLDYTPLAPALPYVTQIEASDAELAVLRAAFQAALDHARIEPTGPLAAALEALCIGDVDTSGALDTAAYTVAIDDIRADLAATVDVATTYSCPGPTAATTVTKDEAYLSELAALVARRSAAVAPSSTVATQPAQVWDVLPGGRRVRIIWPGGTAAAHAVLSVASAPEPLSRTAGCVGFLGTRQPHHALSPGAEADVAACWKADAAIVAGLSPAAVAAYCVAEREPGGEWGNLVLLRGGGDKLAQALQAFHGGNAVHSHAVNAISPRYYASVRIHRALLWSSAIVKPGETSEATEATEATETAATTATRFSCRALRTLQVEYAPPRLGLAPVRSIHHWAEQPATAV